MAKKATKAAEVQALPTGYTPDLKKVYKEEIVPAKNNGMSAFIYTQLSDVEEEMNGFVTYDRKEIKVDIKKIKELNDLI